jgi:hypothetical protein
LNVSNPDGPVTDLHPQLLRDAFAVLDRHSMRIADRDPVRSLNADRSGLLRRVRAALEPLIFNGIVRREDVTDIARRIDEALATGCADAQTTNLRMRMLR